MSTVEQRKVIFARHGETEANREQTLQGRRIDSPLSLEGILQARRLSGKLQSCGIGVVYSSDLMRVTQTAAILAENLHLKVRVEPGLSERDWGEFTGKKLADIVREYENKGDWRRASVSGMESLEDFWARILTTYQTIVDAHPNTNILIVSSGGQYP